MRLYNNTEWRKLRKWFIMEHPLCEECMKNNDKVTPAEHVHHRNSPFESGISEIERLQRLLDWNNLEALCATCHSRLHNEELKKKKEKL